MGIYFLVVLKELIADDDHSGDVFANDDVLPIIVAMYLYIMTYLPIIVAMYLHIMTYLPIIVAMYLQSFTSCGDSRCPAWITTLHPPTPVRKPSKYFNIVMK